MTPAVVDKHVITCPITGDRSGFEQSVAPNPLDATQTCNLLNSHKTSYYRHTYDPTAIRQRMLATGLFPDMDQTFGFHGREGCCNCIAISLYYRIGARLAKLNMYLSTIRRSVETVKQHLPDWIVRLYLDSSVYQSVIDYEAKRQQTGQPDEAMYLSECLDYLLGADNVEVYMYCCTSKPGIGDALAHLRTFRLLVLSDPSVNVRVIREADGIVTNQDCHNLTVFAHSDRIFDVAGFGLGADHTEVYNPSFKRVYSAWLQLYIDCLEKEYFEAKQHLFDILAGVFSLHLTVHRTYYDQKVAEIKTMIRHTKKISGSWWYRNCSRGVNPSILDNGFDEILLLHLFRDYISAPIQMDSYYKFTDPTVNQSLLSLIYSQYDYQRFTFSMVRSRSRPV